MTFSFQRGITGLTKQLDEVTQMATYETMMESAAMYQEAAAANHVKMTEAADEFAKATTPYTRGHAMSNYQFYAKRAGQYYTLQRRYRECSI